MSLQNVKFLCKLGWIDKVEKLLRNFIGKLSAGEMTIENKKNLETPKRLLHVYCFTVIFSSCSTYFFFYWTSGVELYTEKEKFTLSVTGSFWSQLKVVVVSMISSRKGNLTRSRPWRHQNTFSFKMTSFITRVFRQRKECKTSWWSMPVS